MRFDLQALAERVRSAGWQDGFASFIGDLPPLEARRVAEEAARNHEGWIVAFGPADFRHALVVDGGLGSLSTALASFCQRLTVAVPAGSSTVVLRARHHAAGLSHVDCLELADTGLPFSDAAFDAVLIPELTFLAPARARSRALAELTREVHRVLAPGGQAWLELRRAGRSRAAHAARFRALRGAVRRAGLAEAAALPLLVDRNHVQEILLEGYRPTTNPWAPPELAKRIVYSRAVAPWTTPGVALSCFRGSPRPSLLDALQDELRAKGWCTAASGRSVRIHRLRVLPGKAFAWLGTGRPGGECAFVVLPLDDSVLQRRRREATVLEALRRSGLPLAALVPTRSTEGVVHGRPYVALQPLSGYTLDRPGARLDRATDRAVHLLTEFHVATRGRILLDEEGFQAKFARPIRTLIGRLGPESEAAGHRLEAALRARISGSHFPTVWTHGDYKIENLLFDRRGETVLGVIDWDLSDEAGLPLLDLIFLLAYNRLLAGQDIDSTVEQVLLRDAWTARERAILTEYASRLSCGEAQIDAAVAMFWVHHLAYRDWPPSRFRKQAHDRVLGILTTLTEWAESRLASQAGPTAVETDPPLPTPPPSPPPSRKQRLARALAATRLTSLQERIHRRLPYLSILGYHRIVEVDPARYPYDVETISATPREFDRQVAYVRAHFDVLTFAELAGALADRRLPRRPLVITFDDGYRDNSTAAFPILRRHGLRAVVYLATGYIGGTDPFWYEQIVYWFKRTRKRSLRFGPNGTELPLGDRRMETLHQVRTRLKLSNEEDFHRLLTQVQEELGVATDQRELVAILTWDEVRQMHAGGIEFGSHSVSHLNLAAVSPGRLREEVRESKQRIESELRTPVVSLASPFGGHAHHNDAVKRALEEAGYRFGVTYIQGINPLASLDRFALQRIHIELDTDFDMFRAFLQWPRMFVRA